MGFSSRSVHDRSRIKHNLLAIRAVASFRHDDRHDALTSLSLSGTPLPRRPSAFWGTL